MITIGIAEDQALVRESLAIVLELHPDIQVAWTAGSGGDAIAEFNRVPVDVVLMDLRLPGLDGVAATRRIKEQTPDCVILILTTFHHDEWLLDALNAGASACFLKEVPPNMLVEAIRAIKSGSWSPQDWSPEWRLYAPDIQFAVRVSPKTASNPDTLTSRDIEILRLLCAGDTNGEIADKLHLTEGTVKNYVSELYAKLGVRRRAEAVRAAREKGLYLYVTCAGTSGNQ